MNVKLFLAIVVSLLGTISTFGQFPGSLPPMYPPNGGECPPGAWCHPMGEGMSLFEDDLGEALGSPDCKSPKCAIGYYFLEMIKDAYPNCYPNCNLVDDPDYPGDNPGLVDEPEPNEPEVPDTTAQSQAYHGPINSATYSFLTEDFSQMHLKGGKTGFTEKYLNGGRLRSNGKFVYNEGTKNELRVIRMEVFDIKRRKIGLLFFAFDRRHLMINTHKFKPFEKKKRRRRR